MPCPIVPAPITAMVSIAIVSLMISSLRVESRLALFEKCVQPFGGIVKLEASLLRRRFEIKHLVERRVEAFIDGPLDHRVDARRVAREAFGHLHSRRFQLVVSDDAVD